MRTNGIQTRKLRSSERWFRDEFAVEMRWQHYGHLCVYDFFRDQSGALMRYSRIVLFVALSMAVNAGAYAEKICDVHGYGATGDGVTKDTKAIQSAIDDCARTGGTVKIAGAHVFVSGPLNLKSKITLEISPGTTLAASSDHDDFTEESQLRAKGRRPFLEAKDATDIVITGGGVIDGRGESWWPHREAGYTRPRLIVFYHCKRVRMENITAQNSPMWISVQVPTMHGCGSICRISVSNRRKRWPKLFSAGCAASIAPCAWM